MSYFYVIDRQCAVGIFDFIEAITIYEIPGFMMLNDHPRRAVSAYLSSLLRIFDCVFLQGTWRLTTVPNLPA